jgi:hypothetical protein
LQLKVEDGDGAPRPGDLAQVGKAHPMRRREPPPSTARYARHNGASAFAGRSEGKMSEPLQATTLGKDLLAMDPLQRVSQGQGSIRSAPCSSGVER